MHILNRISKINKLLFISVISMLLSFSLNCFAETTTVTVENKATPPQTAVLNSADVAKLKELSTSLKDKSFHSKILAYSELFLGKPYNFDLGERLITWDQNKNKKELLDLSSFDCLSYIETVIALSMINEIPNEDDKFIELINDNLAKIMFNPSSISYEGRNHFTDTEWLKNNSNFVGKNVFKKLKYNKSKIAKINKSGLLETQVKEYAEKYIEPAKRESFIKSYQPKFEKIAREDSKISYITFADFLSHEEEITKASKGKLFVFTMIMDNPKMLELTKSEHNIGHVGFVFTKEGKLYLRHATSVGSKTVVEVPLQDFAKEKEQSKLFPGFTLFKIANKVKK